MRKILIILSRNFIYFAIGLMVLFVSGKIASFLLPLLESSIFYQLLGFLLVLFITRSLGKGIMGELPETIEVKELKK